MASKKGSSDTKKMKKFVDEPMRDKPVTEVPGIGDVHGDSLKEDGFDTAKKLLGKYLQDPDNFKKFLKSHGLNSRERDTVYDAMKRWDDQHN